MMSNSPLVKSSIDSFFHALEHNEMSSEKDRRFSVLHLDQAVELILKEKVKRLGKSIWTRDKATISLYDSKRILEENEPPIILPEWPDIDDLHQLRNDVEHLGRTPSETENKFYAKKTEEFMKRFCKEELIIDLTSYEEKPEIKKHLKNIEVLNYKTFLNDSVSFLSKKEFYNSLINSYIALELILKEKSKNIIKDSERYPIMELLNRMSKMKLLNDDQIMELRNLWTTRNKILHGGEKINENEANATISKIMSIINSLEIDDLDDENLEISSYSVGETDVDRVLSLFFFLLKKEKIQKLTANDVRLWLEKLRQPVPKNINSTLIRLRNKGFIEVSIKKKEGATTWYLTLDGEKYIKSLIKK